MADHDVEEALRGARQQVGDAEAEILDGLLTEGQGRTETSRVSARFEWHRRKAENNLEKHGISFEEAMSVFRDPLARIFSDMEHSELEERELIIGHSVKGRMLLVSFTERAPDVIRIISARKATRLERKDYEENAEG